MFFAFLLYFLLCTVCTIFIINKIKKLAVAGTTVVPVWVRPVILYSTTDYETGEVV